MFCHKSYILFLSIYIHFSLSVYLFHSIYLSQYICLFIPSPLFINGLLHSWVYCVFLINISIYQWFRFNPLSDFECWFFKASTSSLLGKLVQHNLSTLFHFFFFFIFIYFIYSYISDSFFVHKYIYKSPFNISISFYIYIYIYGQILWVFLNLH